MFCMECGTEIAAEAKFCGQCGTKVEKVVSAVAAASNNISSDAVIDEDYTAERYMMQGFKAMHGFDNVLKDGAVAHEFFERAIAIGCVHAYYFQAVLYSGYVGIGQSPGQALKIAKAGAEKGEPRCFFIMWLIYTGDGFGDALKNEGNAELCFQWFLDALKKDPELTARSNYFKRLSHVESGPPPYGVEIDALDGYLEHSFNKLGGTARYPISSFPGKHISTVIYMWIGRIQQALRQIRDARLACISLDQIETFKNPGAPCVDDLVAFQQSLYNNNMQDGHRLMQEAVEGFTKEDLEYCFPKRNNAKEFVDKFMSFSCGLL